MSVNEKMKKVLSFVLVLCMVLSYIPVPAYAVDAEAVQYTEHEADEVSQATAGEVCTCESDDPACHATNCPLYETPAEPQCFCAEKCSEPNIWCDICGFDISHCGGEDTAATYEGCDHSVKATLGYVSSSSHTKSEEAAKYLLDGNPDTKWCGDFGDGLDNYVIFTAGDASVLTSYTLTTGGDTGSGDRHYRNWTEWTIYGSNSPDGGWAEINHVTGATLPRGSKEISGSFSVAPHTPYAYYKLDVNAVFGLGSPPSQQMADITIKKSAIVNGVCSECNKPCPHKAWKDGKCIFCGTPCAHSNWQNNQCLICGIVCSHGDILELTCVEGSAGYNDAENAASLFDGEQNTKWCSKFAAGETSVIFTPGKETVLKSYTLTTGADTGSEDRHYRNWKDWTLYGSNNPNDDASWIPIQAINSADLPTTDHTISRDFVVAAHAPYTHFKLVITAIISGGAQQMAELTATGSSFQNSVCQCGFTCQNHVYVDYACQTCGKACPHANGYKGGYCKDCGMLHDHTGETFENGAYTDCGYACSHTGVLSLHFVEGTGHNPWLLLDGRSDTFWWSKHPMHGEEYVIFVSSAPSVFSSYTLTANKNFPKESLWTSWTLYGSYNRDKNWTVIHKVEDTSLELDENFVSQTFTVEPHIPYPYYKLDLYEIESDYWETEQNMSEITITGLRLENNTCARCGFHCSDHSYKNGFCEDCLLEHDHSGETFTGGKGEDCGYVCPHLQYDEDDKCILCKLACAHNFNGNTCEDCGFVCDHSVGYEKGNCKRCGTEHDHTDEGYTNGAHTICHKPCPHVEYNKETHKCTVCQMACSHEKGHTKGVCNACETVCDHTTSGYSATGFCNTCEQYEHAPQNNDGVYQISNAGQLYWFAQQVNSGSTSISADLTCNIDVSNAPTKGIWTPIAADKEYQGTFDGNGYTIDGIVVGNGSRNGFFSCVGNMGIVRNLGLGSNCSVMGYRETGGICGRNKGTIDRCWSTGTVNASIDHNYEYVGGIVGWNDKTVQNCWFNGKTNTLLALVGVCGRYGTGPQNSYFGVNGSNSDFATGEIAFNLRAGMETTGQVWGQNLDNGNPKDANPVLNGPQVYQVTDCKGNTYYSNSNSNGGHQFGSDGTCVCGAAECSHERTTLIIDDSDTHSDRCTICNFVKKTEPHAFDLLTGLCDCGAKCTHNFENGTCVNCQSVCTHDPINSKGKCPCGTYYPAKLVGDVYQIENNEQLHWFAMKVNAGFNAISGKLMEDIAVTGVWTPMNAYCGTFDGNGKTITGLYNLDSSKSNVGFFGTVEASGTVKNLRVKDAHFLGRLFVGAIAGQNKGTILNCAASANLSANTYIGGLVGQVLEGGSIANCYSTATVNATRDPGGIAGKITDSGTVANCYYLSDADQSEAKTQAQFASGEVAYLLQGDQTAHVWGQTIGTDAYPVLGGGKVYQGYTSCGNDGIIYSNNSNASQTKPAHSGEFIYTVDETDKTKHQKKYVCCGMTETEDHTLTYTANGNIITESCSKCKASLATATISAADTTYDKTEKKTATVTYSEGWTGGELTVSYKNNVNAGTATASITLGEATASVEFTIAKAIINDVVDPEFAEGLVYDGTEKALVTVHGSATGGKFLYSLVANGEYTETLPVATEAGEYYVYWIVQGDENHEDLGGPGKTYAAVTIAAKPVTDATVTLGEYDSVYNGTAKEPGVASVDDMTLTAGKDYTVTYSNNVNVGTATVTIQGIGNFTGTVNKTFTISKAPLTVTADSKTMTTGYALPTLTYTITGFVNGETEDVLITKPTVRCETDGKTAGAYDITVSGAEADNYEITHVNGTLSVADHQHAWTYTADGDTITAKCGNADTCSNAEQTIKIAAEGKTYDGTPVTATLTGNIDSVDTPAICYFKNSVELNESVINAGTYTASIKLGDAEARVNFTITPVSLEDAEVTVTTGITYNGSAIEPDMTVKLGEKTLTVADYDVAYANNQNVGTATVTITGKGNYKDTASTTFTIVKAVAPEIQWPTAGNMVYGQKLSESALTSTDVNGTFAWQDGNIVPTVTNDGFVAVYTPKDTDNYDYSNVALTQTISVTVSKATATVTAAPAAKELTYTGEEQALVNAGATNDGKLVCSLSEDGEFTETIPVGLDAGEYTVWYYVKGDDNHSDSAKASVKVTIAKAKAEITVNTDPITVTYGESVELPAATTNFGAVTCDKRAEDLVNVGTYTVTYTVENTDNYEGDSKSVTVTINAEVVDQPTEPSEPEKPENHSGGTATCMAQAVCVVCGESYGDKDPAKHTGVNYTEGAVEATCGAAGYSGDTYCECGAKVADGEVIPATGAHTGGTATCMAQAVCVVCGESYGDKDPTKHTGVNHTEGAVEATCGAAGYTGDMVCECGVKVGNGEAIPATGDHNFQEGECADCGAEDPDYVKPGEPTEPSEPEQKEPIRVSGKDRYETSFAIANEMKAALGVEKFQNVVLASSASFADALSGSYLAAVKNAPIILAKAKYADKVCAYLNENLAPGATVYVLGGEEAMPASILDGMQIDYKPVRLAGADRYGTNLEILKTASIEGKDLLITTGGDFADSLSASATGLPILLVNGKEGKQLTEAQEEFLMTVKGNIYIIGGESAVPSSMQAEIEAVTGKTTVRVSGKNRYETSIEVARTFMPDAEKTVVAYAGNFPDGLCGGPLAYVVGAPLILTKDGKSEAPAYTKANAITAGYVLGGAGLISDGFAQTIFQVTESLK